MLAGVPPFADFLDELAAERVQIVGRAAADESVVDHDFLIYPVRAGVAEIGADALHRRQRAPFDHTRFDQRPRSVTDRAYGFVRREEFAHEAYGLLVGAQGVGIEHATG